MLKRVSVVIAILMIPMVLLAGPGKIRGKVIDRDSKEPLIGATVQIAGTTQGAVTDVDGNFIILDVQPGTYALKSSYVGYQTITISNIQVNSDLTTETNFNLPVEGVQVPTVEIVAQRPLVNKNATNAVRIQTSEDIAAVPTRGVNNVLALQPGVVLQDNTVYIRGGRLDEVGYYLEGVPITNRMTGGRAVTLSQDALEEITVQAGGYNAEFGEANAGIIQSQLKSGTQNLKGSFEYITDNLSVKSKGDAYNGAKTFGSYQYGYDEMIGSLSGPIVSDRIKFFGLMDYTFQRDPTPQPFPGINLGTIADPTSKDSITLTYPAGPVINSSVNQYNFSGTLSADLNPVQLRASGAYTTNKSFTAFTAARNAGNIANFLNTGRNEQIDATNGAFNLKLTHLLNPTTYYELNAGYFLNNSTTHDPILGDNFLSYGDSVANAQAGVIWNRGPYDNTGRYIRPALITIYTFAFNKPGDVISDYIRFKRSNYTLTGALTSQIGPQNAIKIGGEFERYTFRNYSIGNEAVMALPGLLANLGPNPTHNDSAQVYITRGVNNFGYDVFGNEIDNSDVTGPRHPIFAAGYIQDKIEYQDLILNLGLRYDYINTDSYQFAYADSIDASINYNTFRLNQANLVKASSYSGVSPRLGFSFPVTDRTVFHAQYGKFIQQSRLRDLYQGIFATASNLHGGFFIPAPVGFNVRPERTTQYEIGFTQQVGEFASFDITGYYKDITDQIVYTQTNASTGSQWGSYYTLINGDFATTKGIEMTLNLRRMKRLQMNASLSFNDAQGTGSDPYSNRGVVGAPLQGGAFVPQYITPLEYNNAVRGNINMDYHFEKNDGPEILQQAGASVLLSFNSGHPYTIGTAGADEFDPRFRTPLEPLNSSTTPWVFQVDFRIDKTFPVANRFGANIYIQAVNVFNSLNVANVFLRTGSATDNGYLSDPGLGAKLVTQYGQQYADLYRAVNVDYFEQWQNAAGLTTAPLLFGPPRQIRFGVRLEY